MNKLIFGDLHLKKEELKECILVLEEIGMLCNKHNVDQVINLGDTFDKINPESECLDVFSTFINRLNKPMTLLAANSHESTTQEHSIVNHFGILNNSITVVKEYIDETFLYCGHFILNESKINYGAKLGKKDLEQYKLVYLGHLHSHQIIKPNICHLGACRWVDFGESQDKAKVVCLIQNYKEKDQKIHFIALKSPYPMVDVHLHEKVVLGASGEEIQGKFEAILDKLDPNNKVRVLFHDFQSYTQVIPLLQQYKNKFVLYKEKKEFIVSDIADLSAKSQTIPLKESLTKYLEINKIDDSIKQILLEELK
jgi:DNA repair exonuclease SbcCD nuclease subunit